jgi:hypothetical protein
MNKLRNLKDVITAPTMVKVKRVFAAEVNNYGKNQMNSIVELNNEDLYATFKEKDFDKAVVGNQLFANPKKYQDKPYIEWLAAPGVQFKPADMPFKNESSPVAEDRNDRIMRAQCVNLASEKIGRYPPAPPIVDYEKFLVTEAQKIYDAVRSFINQ